MKSLTDMLIEALTRPTGYLDYPSLQMLRATSKFFYHLPPEHLIHAVFLELKMDYLPLHDIIDWDNTLPVACSICHCLVGTESNTLEETGRPLKTCQCGRQHYNIRRPGVLVYDECMMSNCEKCGDGDELCGPMLVCQPCWGGEGRTDAGKQKKRRQFCTRYGHWLRLVWRDGRAKYGHTKTLAYHLHLMRGRSRSELPKFSLEADAGEAMTDAVTESREGKDATENVEELSTSQDSGAF